MRPAELRASEFEVVAGAKLPGCVFREAGGLSLQVQPTAGVFALRHGTTLLNQVLPGPADEGLTRLWLRVRGEAQRCVSLLSPECGARVVEAGPGAVAWESESAGLRVRATLQLLGEPLGWRWVVAVENTASAAASFEVLLAQDLGLADEGGVRGNEAYCSHYIDHEPVRDPALGWVLFARQNQPQNGGRFPWLASLCREGAIAFASDLVQFLGADHRATGRPAALDAAELPSKRLQAECAAACLQSPVLAVAPGASAEVVFLSFFQTDHPEPSTAADLAWVSAQVVRAEALAVPTPETDTVRIAGRSWFTAAAMLTGETALRPVLEATYPGAWRHEERGADGAPWSWFTADDAHVVTRAKETIVERPHGHILRSGSTLWLDPDQLGATVYAAGVFGAQLYLGNTNLARATSVVRNALGLARSQGLRLFVQLDGGWRQLGVPSFWENATGRVRWVYLVGERRLEVTASASTELAAITLRLETTAGEPVAWKVSAHVGLGGHEHEAGGRVRFDPVRGLVMLTPDAASLLGQREPSTRFGVLAHGPRTLAAVGGDALLHLDGAGRGGPYLVLDTQALARVELSLLGTRSGAEGLVALAARVLAGEDAGAGKPFPAPVRLRHARSKSIRRVDTIIPWFAYDAAIHFTAPHGLEQYGGAAWGTRDVCQGSVEWLLSCGRTADVRRLLATVFSRQYAKDGGWPQWFMHPPYRFIEGVHSHGDVPFWPVKALCDYLEASGDFAFLDEALPYVDKDNVERELPAESLRAHVDRVVAHYEARLLPGTALVNYGDGDWDDTLQPADPAWRTRLVSSWTVALAWHTFRLLRGVWEHTGDTVRATKLTSLLDGAAHDFRRLLMPDGVTAGFGLAPEVGEPGASLLPLLHPRDTASGIRYRLLPMTRAMLAHLFTPEEAAHHAALIREHLLFPDGARLMSDPVPYHGGRRTRFQRAETAANVGREISLNYLHAHLRYAEAMALLGDADALWRALQLANPVELAAVLPAAAPRQANVYFSSSDAAFADRYEAGRRYAELRTGTVPLRAGWRLYSSGPGLFLHKVTTCLLGLRPSWDALAVDPVLPAELDGLVALWHWAGRPVEVVYHLRSGAAHTPRELRLNGSLLPTTPDTGNPYRTGGLRVVNRELEKRLLPGANRLEVLL